MHTFAALNQLPETKGNPKITMIYFIFIGTTLYNINERAAILCVSQKHKMKIFQWQMGTGFSLRREISYPESPRAILCLGSSTGSVVVGFKKHYELTDLQTSNSSKILDFDKEHRLVAFEVIFCLYFLTFLDSCDVFKN